METFLGAWIFFGVTMTLVLLALIYFRLGEIRDACEYLAEKAEKKFRQDMGVDDV